MGFILTPVNGIVLGHGVSSKIVKPGFDGGVNLLDYR
jgi:hypothetical protein